MSASSREEIRRELLSNPTQASVTRLVKQHPDIAAPQDIVALLRLDIRGIAGIIIENIDRMPQVSQSPLVREAFRDYALRSSRDPGFLEKYLAYKRG